MTVVLKKILWTFLRKTIQIQWFKNNAGIFNLNCISELVSLSQSSTKVLKL